MAIRSKKAVAEQPLDPNLKWLIVEEAARYLRVSPQYIRRVIHAGELKAARFGQGYRLDRADLDLFLTRRKKIMPPYRKGSHPWVAARHAQNRAAR